MCDPLTAAIALTVIGTGVSYVGEQKAASAREKTFMAERIRQQGLTEEQNRRFQDSVAKTTDMVDPAAVAKAKADREGVLVNAVQPEGGGSSYLPGASSAPSVVASANDKAQGAARGRTLDLAGAIAALGGTGDQLQRLNIDIGRNSEAIDQAHGFKAGSSGVLNDEMVAASAKGGNLRTLGGLAQQIGSAWMGASMAPVQGLDATLPTFGAPARSIPVSGWGIPGVY